MSIFDFIIKFALPIIFIGILIAIILPFVFPLVLSSFTLGLIYCIPLYCIIFVILYPFSVYEKKKYEIDFNMHFFATNLSILSSSNIQKKMILKDIAEKKEYGELGKEINKIFVMIDTWNLTFSEACRFVADRTPSDLLSDFLDRFACSSESGEPIKNFLINENETIMVNFTDMYENSLYDMETFKDIYISMLITMSFLMSFVMILPMIVGMSVGKLVMTCSFLFISVEFILAYLFKIKMPFDPIWGKFKDIDKNITNKIKSRYVISIICCVFIAIILLYIDILPLSLSIPTTLTPLLIVGFVIQDEDKKIRKRENNYSAFIRTLGATTQARGGMLEEALKPLVRHNFGPLSKNIERLFKRLKIHIDKLYSWELFSKETASNLIIRMNNMFTKVLYSGVNTEKAGNSISKNFTTLVDIRKRRFLSATSTLGIVYGLMAALSFTLYSTFYIIEGINSMYMKMNIQDKFLSMFFSPIDSNIISLSLLCIIITHALISSVIIRYMNGTHPLNLNINFVCLMWTGCITSIIAEIVLSVIISF